MESINVMIDDAFSEEQIVRDWDKLDHSSVGSITVAQNKEKSIPKPRNSPKGLDTPNKEQSSSDKSKHPKESASRVKCNHPKGQYYWRFR